MKSNTEKSTFRIISLSLLTTIYILLIKPLSLNILTVRIGFGFLPMAFIGAIYGPFWCAVACGVGDIIGGFVFPTGPYFPGFTLSAVLTGLVYGFAFKNHKINMRNTLVAALIVTIFINLFLDTYWLYLLYDQGVAAMLPARLIKCGIMFALQLLLIPLIWNKFMIKIPSIKEYISEK